jgi:hypothetical protein
MPPLKETLTQVKERSAREIRNRTAARVLQLAAETRGSQALVSTSSFDEEDDKITLESSVKQGFNQPALGFSTTLVLVCFLLWVLIANALLIQYIVTKRT